MAKGHPATQARPLAAAGFTVKSGWGSAVLLTGSVASPSVVDSRRVELSDPAVPESRQPYHASFGKARSAGPARTRLIGSVERFGSRALTKLFADYVSGHELEGIGLVVGSLIDPERLGNVHFRIHAYEGKLFRGVVEDAAASISLHCRIWRERDLHGAAADLLGRSEGLLRKTVSDLGRTVAGPWRAEQKAAALAAWLVLAGRVPAKPAARAPGIR